MAGDPKWTRDIPPQACALAAARRLLRRRVRTIAQWLPRAAWHADQDIEHVHQLRVATRRAVAALDAFQPFLPRRRGKKLRRLVKDIRQAAGEARDLDVLAASLAAASGDQDARLLDSVRARRLAAQEPLHEIHRRAIEQRQLKRRTQRVLRRLAPPGGRLPGPTFADWARCEVTRRVEQFFALAAADGSDLARLHEFRIVGKRLRYALEMFAGVLGKGLRKRAYPRLTALQEHLGRINDAVVARDRYERWATAADDTAAGDTAAGDTAYADFLRGLRDRETARLATELSAYREWWTAARRKKFRRLLERELRR